MHVHSLSEFQWNMNSKLLQIISINFLSIVININFYFESGHIKLTLYREVLKLLSDRPTYSLFQKKQKFNSKFLNTPANTDIK